MKLTKNDIMKYKNSAYRSMLLSKYGFSKPTTDKNKNDLKRWTNEKWINLTGLIDKGILLPCGKKYKGQISPSVCRPSIYINKNTPLPLVKDLTKKQIRKAIKIKEKGNRINWKNL